MSESQNQDFQDEWQVNPFFRFSIYCSQRTTQAHRVQKQFIWILLSQVIFSAKNAIKLSLGEHAGSPLQPLNTWGLVGAYLRVCP